uniref:Uncharacterized protein n=1 Tax=Globodera rostochiensis TaxID=31243 RepID=A0A914GQQ0_GLORO
MNYSRLRSWAGGRHSLDEWNVPWHRTFYRELQRLLLLLLMSVGRQNNAEDNGRGQEASSCAQGGSDQSSQSSTNFRFFSLSLTQFGVGGGHGESFLPGRARLLKKAAKKFRKAKCSGCNGRSLKMQ